MGIDVIAVLLIVIVVTAVAVVKAARAPASAQRIGEETRERQRSFGPQDEHDGVWVDGVLTSVDLVGKNYQGHPLAVVTVDVLDVPEFVSGVLPAGHTDSLRANSKVTVRVEDGFVENLFGATWDGRPDAVLAAVASRLALPAPEKTPDGWQITGELEGRSATVALGTDGWLCIEIEHHFGEIDLDFRATTEESPLEDYEEEVLDSLVVEAGDEPQSNAVLARLGEERELAARLEEFCRCLEGWVTFLEDSVEFAGQLIVPEQELTRDVVMDALDLLVRLEGAPPTSEAPVEW